MNKVFYNLLILIFPMILMAESPLKPVRTESPRDTMLSFMEAMDDYHKGVKTNNKSLKARIEDAIRTFDAADLNLVNKNRHLEKMAIYLKETIDRVILINYELIPDEAAIKEKSLARWRLKDTEIKIIQKTDSERKGEYLFSSNTVANAQRYYERVKDLAYLAGTTNGAGLEKNWLDIKLPQWWMEETLEFKNWQWMGVLLFIFLGFLGKFIVEFVLHNITKLTEKSKNNWDDKIINAIDTYVGRLSSAVIWLIGLHFLAFEGNLENILDIGLKVIISLHVIQIVYQLVDVFSDFLNVKAQETEFPLDDQMVAMIRKTLRLFTIVFGVLIAIQNLGINVMSVLAGLGLGGLAFALAAKDACANLFGSIMILMDKPFKVGDSISVSGLDGTVEEIGFRSTKIRTFYSSLVSIPNASLANANIDNLGRRKYRRTNVQLGLTYQTTTQEMEAFLEGCKNILKSNEYVVKDNYHVSFHSYGDSSLNVLLYFFLDVPDWGLELVEKQKIYLSIMKLAGDIGVSFAFPSQSLYIESTPEKPLEEVKVKSLDELKTLAKQYMNEGSVAKGEGIYTPRFAENQ